MSKIITIERIQYLKKKTRLSQILQAEATSSNLRHSDLAEMTGIAQSTVSRCLSGDMPVSKENAEKLARALGLDIEWVVCLAFAEKELAELLEKYSDYPTIHAFLSNIRARVGMA